MILAALVATKSGVLWPAYPIRLWARARLTVKFPAKWNREIIVPSRELNPLIREVFRRIREDRTVRTGPNPPTTICPLTGRPPPS